MLITRPSSKLLLWTPPPTTAPNPRHDGFSNARVISGSIAKLDVWPAIIASRIVSKADRC
jgi:hypothetical protein